MTDRFSGSDWSRDSLRRQPWHSSRQPSLLAVGLWPRPRAAGRQALSGYLAERGDRHRGRHGQGRAGHRGRDHPVQPEQLRADRAHEDRGRSARTDATRSRRTPGITVVTYGGEVAKKYHGRRPPEETSPRSAPERTRSISTSWERGQEFVVSTVTKKTRQVQEAIARLDASGWRIGEGPEVRTSGAILASGTTCRPRSSGEPQRMPSRAGRPARIAVHHPGPGRSPAASGVGMVRARRGRPDPDRLWADAERAFLAGQWDRARASLKTLERMRPRTGLDWMLEAQLATAEGRLDEALAAIGRIPDDHPIAAQAHLAGRPDRAAAPPSPGKRRPPFGRPWRSSPG